MQAIAERGNIKLCDFFLRVGLRFISTGLSILARIIFLIA